MRCWLLLLLGALMAVGPISTPAPAATRTLNVFIWSEYLDPDVVRDFERQHDARVTIDLYEDAEAMMAKLQAGGASLYDIVVPSDYLVPPMIKLGLLAPLRHERIPNLKNLDARFTGPPFDPRNEYTVAYQWGTVGIYYREAKDKPSPDSWAAVFDARQQFGPFVLIDSMRDAIGAALQYRGHGLNTVDAPALREIRDLLLNAKRRCVAMEGSVGGRNRVLAGTAAAAIVYSGEAARGMKDGLRDPEGRQPDLAR
jgi:spermidine/putrescine transport system substrate-binding protein